MLRCRLNLKKKYILLDRLKKKKVKKVKQNNKLKN